LTESPDAVASTAETGIASCEHTNWVARNTLAKKDVFCKKFIKPNIKFSYKII
jgi:hypothetical protein